MLNTNVKTHKVLIKEGPRDIKKIGLTTAQYQLLKDEVDIKKYSDMITIHDIDTDEKLFEGRASKIEGFEEIKQDPGMSGAVWICDFGNRHPLIMQGECDCKKEFDCLSIVFKERLQKMGFKVDYPSDITDLMRTRYKQKYLTK